MHLAFLSIIFHLFEKKYFAEKLFLEKIKFFHGLLEKELLQLDSCNNQLKSQNIFNPFCPIFKPPSINYNTFLIS